MHILHPTTSGLSHRRRQSRGISRTHTATFTRPPLLHLLQGLPAFPFLPVRRTSTFLWLFLRNFCWSPVVPHLMVKEAHDWTSKFGLKHPVETHTTGQIEEQVPVRCLTDSSLHIRTFCTALSALRQIVLLQASNHINNPVSQFIERRFTRP